LYPAGFFLVLFFFTSAVDDDDAPLPDAELPPLVAVVGDDVPCWVSPWSAATGLLLLLFGAMRRLCGLKSIVGNPALMIAIIIPGL
jgi:hypothetical protein